MPDEAPDFIGPCRTCLQWDMLARDEENHAYCKRCQMLTADSVRKIMRMPSYERQAYILSMLEPLKTPTKQRVGDQPLPNKNDLPVIQDLVMADIETRKKIGLQRYGTLLQPFNGRDAMTDVYEELLDAAIYMRQLIYERDHR